MNTPQQSASLKLQIILIAMVVSSFATTDFYLPSLPAITEYFHISTTNAQFTITIFLFSISLMPLFYGPLSDYFGRKSILMLGYLIFMLGSLLCTFTQTFTGLLIGRFLQGLGICAASLLSRVILRDCYSGTELAKNTGKLALWTTTALALSPMIGGFIQQYFGFRVSFALLFFCGLLLFLFIHFHLPETNLFKKTQPLHFFSIAKNYLLVVKNPIFIAYSLTSGIALSAIIAYSIVNPFLMQTTLHVTPKMYGILILIVSTGLILGASINVRLVGKLGINQMIMLGSICLFFAGLLLLVTGLMNYLNLFILVMICFMVSFATSFIFPNAMSGSLSLFPKSVGTAGAIYGCIQALTSTQVSSIVSQFKTDNQIPLAWTYMVLAVTTLFLTMLIVVLNKRSDSLSLYLDPINKDK